MKLNKRQHPKFGHAGKAWMQTIGRFESQACRTILSLQAFGNRMISGRHFPTGRGGLRPRLQCPRKVLRSEDFRVCPPCESRGAQMVVKANSFNPDLDPNVFLLGGHPMANRPKQTSR